MESTMNKHQGLHIDGDFSKFFGFRWRRGSESCDTCRFRLVHTHRGGYLQTLKLEIQKTISKKPPPNLKNWYFFRSSLNPKRWDCQSSENTYTYIVIYVCIYTYIYICAFQDVRTNLCIRKYINIFLKIIFWYLHNLHISIYNMHFFVQWI